MIVQEKLGNIKTSPSEKQIDWLLLEWYETNKRILHKRTKGGKEITLRFLSVAPQLTEGDILQEDENALLVVDIIPADAIVISPVNMYEMAAVCYEIGNKHLPLFFDNNTVLVPFDLPLFRLLTAKGYNIHREQRKLIQPLQTTVEAHGNSTSLFSKIMKLSGNE